MATVTIYTSAFCSYCTMAKRLLQQLGINDVNEIRIDTDPQAFAEMQQITGRRTVPQIFIGDTHVGGFTDMQAMHQRGELLPLLEKA